MIRCLCVPPVLPKPIESYKSPLHLHALILHYNCTCSVPSTTYTGCAKGTQSHCQTFLCRMRRSVVFALCVPLVLPVCAALELLHVVPQSRSTRIEETSMGLYMALHRSYRMGSVSAQLRNNFKKKCIGRIF